MTRNRVFILVLVLLLASCAPDPRKEAEANKTNIEADQYALNQEMERKHAQDLHDIEMEKQRALLDEINAGMIRFVRVTLFLGVVFLGTFVFYGTRSVILAFQATTTGLAEAMARAAMVKANLIPMDPVTGTYPLYLHYTGKGRYSLVDPGAGSVLLLDTRNDPDRQMIANAGALQLARVIATQAAQSNDPAGVAIVRPPIINYKDGEVEIGG